MSASAPPLPDTRRAGRRAALAACCPLRDPAMPSQFISNHGMRMVEAALRAAAIDGLELQAFDLTVPSSEGLVDDLLAMDPDIVGFSAYLWCFPLFIEVARALKDSDPTRVVVFGGPAARPAMFQLEPYRESSAHIHALVINEGEDTFVEIVSREGRRRDSLRGIQGLAVPDGGNWV